MKKPEECGSINEIREEIDKIDRKIIENIGKRYNYVKRAGFFKKNQKEVKAEDRVKKMIKTRKDWAIEEGLNPDIIEKIYMILVNYFINEEMNEWKEKKK